MTISIVNKCHFKIEKNKIGFSEKKCIWLFCVAVIFPPVAFGEVPGCKDFLSELALKPEGLEFVRCEKVEETPAVLLKAYYSVSGKTAKSIENFMHKEFGLEKLRFACCGWESRPTIYHDDKGDTYTVNMYSRDEFNFQKKWKDYDKFEVTVGKFLVLP